MKHPRRALGRSLTSIKLQPSNYCAALIESANLRKKLAQVKVDVLFIRQAVIDGRSRECISKALFAIAEYL